MHNFSYDIQRYIYQMNNTTNKLYGKYNAMK